MTAINFFTKTSAISDELQNYKMGLVYSCGDAKAMFDSQQQEYVMQFLMGLNESYISIRSQILRVDPMPSTNQVFSLVIQEQNQRNINSNSLHRIEPAALSTEFIMDKNAASESKIHFQESLDVV